MTQSKIKRIDYVVEFVSFVIFYKRKCFCLKVYDNMRMTENFVPAN